ncbi:hypothetical protein [Aquibacillus kalidii]|uniref:hypothetical protein n=1 Tax=Aquibacillus kalidii TaxID=2762597 RepID=UPI001646CD07|nr:hypothetical protein [Aquibacillus kalidii]
MIGASFGGYITLHLLNSFQNRGAFFLYPLVIHRLDQINIEVNINKYNRVTKIEEDLDKLIKNEISNSMRHTNMNFLNNLLLEAQETEMNLDLPYLVSQFAFYWEGKTLMLVT